MGKWLERPTVVRVSKSREVESRLRRKKKLIFFILYLIYFLYFLY